MSAPLSRGAEHRRLYRLHSLVGLTLALGVLLVVFTAPVSANEPAPVIISCPIATDLAPPFHQFESAIPITTSGSVSKHDTIPNTPRKTQPEGPASSIHRDTTPLIPPPLLPTAPSELSDTTDVIVCVIEIAPQLIGGLERLQERVDSLGIAEPLDVQGTVFVQFIVDEQGRVVDPVVVRSPSELLSEAALKAVRESRFVPGQQRGRPVKVRYSLPVRFVLW